MSAYWCKFFDLRGQIYGAEKMQAVDDAAVVAKAHVIHAHHIGSGYEIWDGERLVHRETFSSQKYVSG